MNQTADAIITSIYNIVLLAVTAYLVMEHSWNPWWFLLTLCLLGSWGNTEKKA